MSVASAEKRNRCPAHQFVVLLVMALALPGPAVAEDEEAADPAAGSAVEPVDRAFIRSAGDTGALAQRYPHLAEWLEPEGAPRVLALVEREAADSPQGAMVILAGEGQSANDPLLEALRSRLTEAGWAAMTLGLDQATPTLQLARERRVASVAQGEGGDPDGPVMIDVNDQAAEDLLEAHYQEMNARLASAVSWFTERDYRRVVLVGIGGGAEAVRGFLAEAPQAVVAVAWVAANFGQRAPEDISEGVAGAGQRPILDMYPSRDPGSVRRRAAFRRAGINGYQSLPAPIGVRPEGRDAGVIAGRLLGWVRPD